jgi:hypothetical protein
MNRQGQTFVKKEVVKYKPKVKIVRKKKVKATNNASVKGKGPKAIQQVSVNVRVPQQKQKSEDKAVSQPLPEIRFVGQQNPTPIYSQPQPLDNRIDEILRTNRNLRDDIENLRRVAAVQPVEERPDQRHNERVKNWLDRQRELNAESSEGRSLSDISSIKSGTTDNSRPSSIASFIQSENGGLNKAFGALPLGSEPRDVRLMSAPRIPNRSPNINIQPFSPLPDTPTPPALNTVAKARLNDKGSSIFRSPISVQEPETPQSSKTSLWKRMFGRKEAPLTPSNQLQLFSPPEASKRRLAFEEEQSFDNQEEALDRFRENGAARSAPNNNAFDYENPNITRRSGRPKKELTKASMINGLKEYMNGDPSEAPHPDLVYERGGRIIFKSPKTLGNLTEDQLRNVYERVSRKK